MLDTNIFVYAVQDRDSLTKDVLAILEDYDNTFYMVAESVKELIVAYYFTCNHSAAAPYFERPQIFIL